LRVPPVCLSLAMHNSALFCFASLLALQATWGLGLWIFC
jgi:hypothetical protein